MAPKRGVVTYRWMFRKGGPGRRTRIKMPQPPYKAVRVRKAVKPRGEINIEKPWQLVIHRHGGRTRTEGVDLESRAVPKWKVRGTLPERILYKALLDRRFTPGVDFDFQSSLDGGRLEFGGILVDFRMFQKRLIIQVNGPTHQFYLRIQKDKEQKDILIDKGYSVIDIDDIDVLDANKLEEFLRKNVDVNRGGAGAGYRTFGGQ